MESNSTNAKTRFTPPAFPQADARNIIGSGGVNAKGHDHILIQIDRQLNSFIDGDTIIVYFANQMSEHLVDSFTDPPSQVPYTFKFAAGNLPDGQYSAYYMVQEPSFLGGIVTVSPLITVIIANARERSGDRGSKAGP